MVKLLAELPELFRERYLNTHEVYLKSIADLIHHLYQGNLQDEATEMIFRLIDAPKMKRRLDTEDETSHFRNLRNCWYHECALNYPPNDLDERMRFAAWKIIQSYYAVFSSIASLVCCDHPERKSISKTLYIFAGEFLCHSKRKNYFLPPTNLYLNQQGKLPKKLSDGIKWDYAQIYHIPNIVKCLSEVRRENNITTIPHYLKKLREWVTYGDAYLFIRLYGESPKQNLDFSLRHISFMFCLQSEFFLLRLFGWDAVNRQFEAFSQDLERNLKIVSEPLTARFKVYSALKKSL